MISRTRIMMLATTRRAAVTTTRRQFQQMPPRLLVRSVTASNDTSGYNHQQPMMIALDCHTGDGSVPIYDATTTDDQHQHQLKDIVNQNHLSSVVVSWPVQEQQSTTTSMLSRSILNNLTDNSFNSNESDTTIKTTKPFYMLDGNGCRRASMCLVKGGSSLESISTDHHHHPAAYQTPGTWLRQFSSLLRHQASVMMLQQ